MAAAEINQPIENAKECTMSVAILSSTQNTKPNRTKDVTSFAKSTKTRIQQHCQQSYCKAHKPSRAKICIFSKNAPKKLKVSNIQKPHYQTVGRQTIRCVQKIIMTIIICLITGKYVVAYKKRTQCFSFQCYLKKQYEASECMLKQQQTMLNLMFVAHTIKTAEISSRGASTTPRQGQQPYCKAQKYWVKQLKS